MSPRSGPAAALFSLLVLVSGCGGGGAATPAPAPSPAPAPAPAAPKPAAADQAGQTDDPSDPPWLREIAPKRIVYSVPGMEQIAPRKKDIEYKQAGSEALTMDVWAPAKAGPRPAIVFIHGGPVPAGLRVPPKEWGVYLSYGQLAAASGFVGVTFNHRFHDYDRVGDALADVRDLVAYLRSHAGELGIDGERICLWAFSGGGSFLSAGLGPSAPPIRCLVSFYGRLDVQVQRAEFPASVSDETLRDASPVHHLASGKRIPPMLIGRAGKDAPEINATVDAFIAEARRRKAPLQVLEHPTGQHAFDILDDDDKTREIIAAAMRFVASHLERR
jgi:acetyl esterase/lipase